MVKRVAGFVTVVWIGAVWAGVCRGADEPDWAALLDRSDVFYHIPTERHEDGLPIGNGDLGTMLWTPTLDGGLMFQFNKADAWTATSPARSGFSARRRRPWHIRMARRIACA